MATPGQRISEYVLDAPIGAGTFGQVWRARHHVWADQLVAIKLPTDPQYVRNLQAEGSSLHGLTHPNIARAIGFDPYGNPPYLITEYVPGTNLRQRIARNLPIEQAVAIMSQTLAGLGYAHANGVIHRDLKPENILLHQRADKEGFSTPGVVKITDFGLGKAASQAVAGSIVYSQSLNNAAGRELAGTLDYMSPEQRSGGEVDPRSDLYACGVILHELLTGERPAGTEVPSDIRKDVPKYLDEVFKRSYARLDKRFASADEFAAALRPGKTVAKLAPARPLYNRTMCPKCQQGIDAGDQFCTHCGTQVAQQVRRCESCGGYPDINDRFCIFCGKPLAGNLRIA